MIIEQKMGDTLASLEIKEELPRKSFTYEVKHGSMRCENSREREADPKAIHPFEVWTV